ncbi:MAG: hypothetical protein AAF928_01095 [Myxococcota bacterium]
MRWHVSLLTLAVGLGWLGACRTDFSDLRAGADGDATTSDTGGATATTTTTSGGGAAGTGGGSAGGGAAAAGGCAPGSLPSPEPGDPPLCDSCAGCLLCAGEECTYACNACGCDCPAQNCPGFGQDRCEALCSEGTTCAPTCSGDVCAFECRGCSAAEFVCGTTVDVCDVSCRDTPDCSVQLEADASAVTVDDSVARVSCGVTSGTCEVTCRGEESDCHLDCGLGADCRLDCELGVPCMFTCGAGCSSDFRCAGTTPQACGGGVSVCNRPCPP